MNLKETEQHIASKVFGDLGGKKIEDADGAYWLFSSGCVLLEVEPFLREKSNEFSVGIDVSISNSELSKIANRICGKRGQQRQRFDWRQWQQYARSEMELENAFRDVLQRAMAEMQTINLNDIADEIAGKPPMDRSLSQLMHLAALAYLGNVRALNEYLEGMNSGNRFGFVPVITTIFLERAIKEAVIRINSERQK